MLMACADANLRFVFINTVAHAKKGDSAVFRDCPFGKKLYTDTLNLPPPRCLKIPSLVSCLERKHSSFLRIFCDHIHEVNQIQQKEFSIIDCLDADAVLSVFGDFVK